MKNYILIFTIFLLASCGSKKETVKEEPLNAQKIEQQKEPQQPSQVTTYKENSTLLSGLVDTLELIDEYQFKLTIKVITAIPDNWNVTVIEPDQIITILPAYIMDENKKIELQNPINMKIFELRNLKKKGILIGKVTLAKDNNYYVTKVDTWQNPPEE